jgi:hypothetical protein
VARSIAARTARRGPRGGRAGTVGRKGRECGFRHEAGGRSVSASVSPQGTQAPRWGEAPNVGRRALGSGSIVGAVLSVFAFRPTGVDGS